MNLTKGQQDVMTSEGHLLVTGGPGSGKTTISILKASQIAEHRLHPGQKVLFLSFARATVSRVIEAIEHEQKIPTAQKQLIHVETYHSFFWRILKTHGYLVGLPRCLSILTPSSEAIALSSIRSAFPVRGATDMQKQARKSLEDKERIRLAHHEGRVCFDLFATYVGDILQGSFRIRRLIATMYPVIIVDEFQDTNEAQWQVVQALGEFCRLIALADPEQRIFDWIGADPARLDHFRDAVTLTEVDLSADNHRSSGTEIVLFGNDILVGKFRQESYLGINCIRFDPLSRPAMTKLITTVYSARQRLIEQEVEGWSLAILVPTKRMTRLVSDAFRAPPAGLTSVAHTAVIDIEAAVLGVEIIAFLMQPIIDDRYFEQFIDLMCNYFQGKGGNSPAQNALQEASNIRRAYDKFLACKAAGNELHKSSLLVNMLSVYEQSRVLLMTGDPDKDWRAIRSVLASGSCKRLKEIAEEVKNIRLLEKGTQLKQQLSQDWRENGRYRNALAITKLAFVQEHFSMSSRPECGVVVMNMHKAKGKQFDEVIIFEGWPILKKGKILYNPDRIVRLNSMGQINDQARQNLRVSVTRGKRQTTILTPHNDPCVLLPT